MPENDGLKRYLRQLREMGESELVFNTLSLRRVVTAAEQSVPVRIAAATSQSHVVPPTAERKHALPDVEDPRDWRATLLAASTKDVVPVAKSSSAQPATKPSVPRYSLTAPNADGSPAAASAPPPQAVAGMEVKTVVRDIFAGAAAFSTLAELANAVAGCRLCPLHSEAKNSVPGEGNPTADLVCVGEGPGASEDETGRPFVGAAGKLLTAILAAIQLQREDVFICNVVKHRPPANRTPLPEEIDICKPYLARQLELVRPKAILALGTTAAQTLLGTKLSIGKLRGQVHRYDGIPLIVTYHPAALLRNPAWKRPTWEDVQHVRRILDGARGA